MKEYIIGNAVVIVTRPTLTEEERSKRERQISIALQQIGKEMIEAEMKIHK